jgi:Rrf2 family transcriptional regulator, iron-sulfur cluster assembly transcription factor
MNHASTFGCEECDWSRLLGAAAARLSVAPVLAEYRSDLVQYSLRRRRGRPDRSASSHLPITCFHNTFGRRHGPFASTLIAKVRAGAGVIITSKSDYGLRAALHLARSQGRVRMRDISASQHIPEAVCAQVMRKLVGAEIVRSVAGPAGGYTLARAPEDISVASVLSAADREICIFRCLDDGCDCELAGRCAFQVVLQGLGRDIADRLERLTLADLRDQQMELEVPFGLRGSGFDFELHSAQRATPGTKQIGKAS